MNAAIPVERILSTPAKVLCSAIWVSGRDAEEAMPTSAFFATPTALCELMEVAIDREERSVTISMELDADTVPRLVDGYRKMYPTFEAAWDAEADRLLAQGTVSRTARYFGDQGSIIMPLDGSGLSFEPVPVETTLPPAADLDWPMGDLVTHSLNGLDRGRMAEAAALAFADPDAHTAAVVVLHRGQIVAEQYAPGIGPETQLESWSMGKSLTATMVGLLIGQGHFTLDSLAPVEAWRQPGDPRGDIRISDLMRMSSGLKFSGMDTTREQWDEGVADHLLVYAEAIDVFEFSTSRDLEYPPNTVGRYRNCDPLTLGSIVRQTVEAQGEQYLTWPQRALFDRIGIRKQVMETDTNGNFILTGFDYGTARNWARLGLLYAQDGVWEGERLLPEGFATFVGTAAPAWDQPEYGGQFWVNGAETYDVPRDMYYMRGAGEQRVIIIPSHDLVVVRLGHRKGDVPGHAAVNEALKALTAAVEAATVR
ncbi:MAG TPA: serine hydrolase [Dehalococcoidia bacterium]|nr:serine hydrolase [Dehalococcoidia bacterium]